MVGMIARILAGFIPMLLGEVFVRKVILILLEAVLGMLEAQLKKAAAKAELTPSEMDDSLVKAAADLLAAVKEAWAIKPK